ncbi:MULTISPECIES: helix-turn-helix transcriptional regulator [unclassified Caballeronia]|uniref:helix-turn-helix transcriptional regulator n=1 Tax=unclassified Caballeronia TaxID=2646786 RepID=UPI00202930B7|nr:MULTISPECIES: helix-turn-helix transcriptional regulator [unclassified Caballeronia]
MATLDSISQIIGEIHEAGFNPALWPQALDDTARCLGCMRAVLWVGPPTGQIRSADCIGIEPRFINAYEQYYGRMDPIFRPATTRREGTVLTDAVVSRAELERGEFYQDWARPQGLHSIFLANFLNEGAVSGVIGMPRSDRDRPIARRDLDLLRLLLPHFRRAIQMQSRMNTPASNGHFTEEALDALGDAIFIVDEAARPLFVNTAAENLLARADALNCSHDGLRGPTVPLTLALRALVARTLAHDDSINCGAIRIAHSGNGAGFNALVSRLGTVTDWPGVRHGTRAALIVVTHSDSCARTPEDALMSLYKLTPAEAAIAQRLARGETLSAIADSLNVRISTARTHLHHVFEKTSMHRQADLVRLVAQMKVISSSTGG